MLPEFAEIVAVGVPPALLTNANFADCVDVDPRRRSSVILTGVTAPRFLCHHPCVPVV